MATKKIALSVPVIASLASATIYIAPPDIDSYKQKSDQVFYDTYQNEKSPLAKGVNPALKNYVNNIKTRNKIATGNTILFVANAQIQGKNLQKNKKSKVTIFGNPYYAVIDDYGNFYLKGATKKAQKYVSGNIMVVREDSNAVIPKGTKVKCVKTKDYKLGKTTYKGCDTYQRPAIDASFNLITGEVKENVVKQNSGAKCKFVTQGKTTTLKCAPKGDWKTIETIRQSVRIIDIKKLLNKINKNVTIKNRKININIPDLKYGNEVRDSRGVNRPLPWNRD